MAYLNKIKAFLEKIINCFIMILLDQAGFTMKFPKKGVLEWTIKHAQVEANMNKKVFKMRTDRTLRSRYRKTVQAAVDAKKAVRAASCCTIKKRALTET